MTCPKNTLKNHKRQLTQTLTNGKNENWKDKTKFENPIIWKPEPKWTKKKNLPKPPLKKLPNSKDEFAFWDKRKTKLAIQRRFCFALWRQPANGLRYLRVGEAVQPEKWKGVENCLGCAQNPQRQVHALLGASTERKTHWLKKNGTTELAKFYTQLDFWQTPKRTRITEMLAKQKPLLI